MDQKALVLKIQRLREGLDELYDQIRLEPPMPDLPERESQDELAQATQLSPAERQILEALDMLSYTEGKILLGDIAATVFLSDAQTWRYLQRLEAKGYVRRIGQRGGWEITSS